MIDLKMVPKNISDYREVLKMIVRFCVRQFHSLFYLFAINSSLISCNVYGF